MKIIFKQQGVNLVEMLLVVVVMASIFVLGLRQIQGIIREQERAGITYNVEKLFNALTRYYQANCGATIKGSVKDSKLSPDKIPYPPTAPVILDIAIDLNTDIHYLSEWDKRINNPLVQNWETDYKVQFNPSDNASPKLFPQVICHSQSPVTPCAPTRIPNAKVIVWLAQVAVKLNLPLAQIPAYKSILHADCVSGLGANDIIVPCDQVELTPPEALDYLVWERLPSFSTPSNMTAYWQSMPLVKQFKLQYTNDPMYDLYNQGQSPSPYYLCGG